MNPREAWLGIGLRPELWRLCRRLSDEEITGVYAAGEAGLAGLLKLSRISARTIRETLVQIDFPKELDHLRAEQIDFLTPADAKYPQTLRNIYDPPAVLFFKGQPDFGRVHVAVVGSRRCSSYGRTVAADIARAAP